MINPTQDTDNFLRFYSQKKQRIDLYLDMSTQKVVGITKLNFKPKSDIKDGLFRLMDAVNVEIAGDDVTYHSTSFEDAREAKARIIQWVPVDSNVNVKIVMDDASVKTGLGESALNDLEVGDVVQFERVGFARLDEICDGELIFYYAHK